MKHYGALLQLISFSCGLTLLTGVAGCKKERDEPVCKYEIQISGMSENEFEPGFQKDGNSVVCDGAASFETRRHSVEDIRVAAYVWALGRLSEWICTNKCVITEKESVLLSTTKSDLAFGEYVIKTSNAMLQAKRDDGSFDDGYFKHEIEFFKGNDLLYRFSYEEPQGGGEVVSLKNKLKLSELMKLLADSKYTVKVISERAILKGRGAVKKDGGIDEVVRFNALEGGSIEFIVVLNVSGIKLHKEE